MLVLIVIFASSIIPVLCDDRVCYKKLGCFNMKPPWLSEERPAPPPDPPKAMKVRAIYFDRNSPNFNEGDNERVLNIVTTWPEVNLNGAPFDGNKMTYFVVHGFENRGTDQWLMDMRKALLSRADANVIIGDWTRGAKGVSYFQAAGNTRMAARQFSNLIYYLVDQHGLNLTRLHLIGHSLGAHICGYIGKSLPGISRITGLDTAQPLFQVTVSPLVKLTRDDAINVDAVHADARPFIPNLGFGYMNPVADVDFYLNGGHGQPGCIIPKVPKPKSIKDFLLLPREIIEDILLCPHGMSHQFFIEAIINVDCTFLGHSATMDNLLTGISNTGTDGFFYKLLGISGACSNTTCARMGLETFDWPARGSYVINTRRKSPYCIPQDKIIPEDDQLLFAYGVEQKINKHLLY